jgi:DNA helicase II / ATP-dependent DNA helicase PcrA
MATSIHIGHLTSEQAGCVNHDGCPMLVLAGPGTGKTEVLACRVACLVADRGVSPDKITAITFTNKAASEMRKRLFQLGIKKDQMPTISTIHSLASRTLRNNYQLCGLPAEFRVAGPRESKLAIFDAVFDAFPKKLRGGFVGDCVARIAKAKSAGRGPDFHSDPDVKTVHHRYQTILSNYGALDMQDLILKCCEMWKLHKGCLDACSAAAEHLLVDEFQDVNQGEYEFIKLLKGTPDGLFAVGDDDQSIYGWRGGDPSIIVNFEKAFSKTLVVELTKCHRCPEHIIRAAISVVSRNSIRRPKNLTPQAIGGHKVKIVSSPSYIAEASWIAKETLGLLQRENNPYKPSDVAVLFRGGDAADKVVEALRNSNVDVARLSEEDITAAESVQYLLAHLRVALERGDDLAVRTCLDSRSAFKLGPAAAQQVRRMAEKNGICLWDGLEKLRNSPKQNKWQKPLSEFSKCMDELFQAATSKPLYEIATMISEKLSLKSEPSVKRLLQRIQKLPGDMSVPQFLEDARLGKLQEADVQTEAVSIITTHAVKGMGHKLVFVVGMEQGAFPTIGGSDLEEQRRLFYVAMTRANSRLYLCNSKMRKGRSARGISLSNPSQFLGEIDRAHAESIYATSKKNQKLLQST